MPERKRIPLVWGLAALAAAALAFYHLYHVLIPFLLSFALAYVLSPVIGLFEARGLRRQVVVVALYLGAAAAAGLLANTAANLALGQLQEFKSQGPRYEAKTEAFVESLRVGLNARLPFGLRLRRPAVEDVQSSLMSQAQNLPGLVLGVFPVLSLLFLVPFITFFLLADGQASIDALIQRCPSRYVEQALHLVSEIDASLGNYVRGLVFVAAAIFLASFVGLVILGVDQALGIAAVAGISSFIPYAGAVLGAVVGGLAAGFQFGTLAAGLKVVALFVLIRIGDEILLQPFVARHSVKLHPLLFLLALMVGGDLFGFVGLLFAIPVLCILKALTRVLLAWYASEAAGPAAPEIADAAAVPFV